LRLQPLFEQSSGNALRGHLLTGPSFVSALDEWELDPRARSRGLRVFLGKPTPQQVGDRVLELAILLDGENLDVLHQILGQVQSCFHNAIIPEIWFYGEIGTLSFLRRSCAAYAAVDGGREYSAKSHSNVESGQGLLFVSCARDGADRMLAASKVPKAVASQVLVRMVAPPSNAQVGSKTKAKELSLRKKRGKL
jgi:hypothetical protein